MCIHACAAVPGCVATFMSEWSLVHGAVTINLGESAVNTHELALYCARVDDRRGVYIARHRNQQ
jgi:hypothetical protein